MQVSESMHWLMEIKFRYGEALVKLKQHKNLKNELLNKQKFQQIR